MKVAGSHVAIVGGSIAGCAAAIALMRAGCRVEVLERSQGDLRGRGFGISMPVTLLDELQDRGYLPRSYPSCDMGGRLWIIQDGSAMGRVMWHQPGSGRTNNWSVLWRLLRAGVADDHYHGSSTVLAFSEDTDDITVELGADNFAKFDILIAADGYRSIFRPYLNRDNHLDYSGYVMWRGNFEESRLMDDRITRQSDAASAWQMVCFPRGHAFFYMIPGFDGRTDRGRRRINWGVYASPRTALQFDEPVSMRPGEVSPELHEDLDALLTKHFPPAFAALVRLSAYHEIAVQPIYDQRIDRYVGRQILLIGDAGSLTRPHTASGATKALQDALTLESLATELSDWADVLKAYDVERVAHSNSIVELGRRLGRSQVEETPDWATMTIPDLEDWVRTTLAGEGLFLYPGTRQ